MSNKPRLDSLYSRLTEDQRAQLYDWILMLGYTKTIERIALAEPEGFGIETHLSRLHAFFQRYSAEQDSEHVSDAAQLHQPTPSELFPLAVQAAHAGAFRLSTAPLDANSFGQLSQWVNTQQATELKRSYLNLAQQNTAIAERKATLAEERHAFEREKYELNVAQLALEHVTTLQRIRTDHHLTTQARIRAARELLYGPDPSHHQTASAVSPTPPTNLLIHSSIKPAPFPKPVAAHGNSAANVPSEPALPTTATVQNNTNVGRARSPSAPSTTSNAPTNPLIHSSTNLAIAPTNPKAGPSNNPVPEPSLLSPLPSVEKSVKSEQPALGNSQPSCQNSKLKDHAIKRWRAHIPRAYHDPEPDGSWRDECPCGNPHPCPDHPDLWLNVKGIKPQNPDYRVCLETAGVPFYMPTPEELGCTQDKLDQALNPFAFNPQSHEPADARLAPLYPPGSNPFLPLSCAGKHRQS